MNKLGILLLSAASATALIIGCDGGDETTTTTTTTSSSSSTSSGGGSGGSGGGDLGVMPKYGAQVDRFGRPAINTAVNHTFDGDMATKGAAKDAYNADADPTKWGANYAGEIAANLGILDSLDTVCGNQLLAGPNVDAMRYSGLAGALADDRQWLNTAGATCTTYLAVEANALKIIPNMDCGGRGLDYDVIDVSYSVLAVGAPSGVVDGVAVPDHAKGKTFPYLAAPK